MKKLPVFLAVIAFVVFGIVSSPRRMKYLKAQLEVMRAKAQQAAPPLA